MQIVGFDNKGFRREWAAHRNRASVIFVEDLES